MPNWKLDLEAPPEAREFYEALEKAHKAGAFESCHVFARRKPSCVPLRGPQLCGTLGCINPQHWANQTRFVTKPRRPKPGRYIPNLDELIEVVEFYLNSPPFPRKDYDSLRAVIPKEDMSDFNLKSVLDRYINTNGTS